jgi:eukaryotic-like serine/threonine-protein kinase
MARDLAALLETQADLQHTAPSTTIVPRELGLEQAIGLLEQMAGAPLLASIQLRTGAVIGQGGMGVVREAEQVALGRTVAVKTVKDDKRSPEAAQGLLREAWVTGSLEHPNVVPVHHLGLDEHGMPAIVLKRIEGVEWSRLIGNADEVKRRYGATDLLAWNLSILMQVLNAIRFAHNRGILHRDLKPANVMIGDFGEVYLLDWGVAVSLRDDASGRLPLAKDATNIAGTPCYMAPEMLAPDGNVPLSESTDVYLAGAVLFEIVVGRPPHLGKTAVEVMTSVLTSRPEVPDDVPAELASICRKAMAHDPAERFESAEAVRLALQGYLEHRGSDQLVQRAKLRLDELAALLATAPVDRSRHREELYRLFGACRFGFHEALAVWKENTAARTGLRRATIAVAEYELASGDPHSAVTLLSELDEPPALLARAREAAAKQADRQRALEDLDYAHDLAVGRGERGRLATTIGIAFTIAPLVLQSTVGPAFENHPVHIAWSGLFALIVLAWTWLGRSRLTTTLVNRRLLFTMIFMFFAQVLLMACMWRLGVSLAHSQVLMLFLYFVTAGLVTTTVDRTIAPTAVAYAIIFVVATFHIEYRYYLLSAGNAVFTINVLLSWRLQPG